MNTIRLVDTFLMHLHQYHKEDRNSVLQSFVDVLSQRLKVDKGSIVNAMEAGRELKHPENFLVLIADIERNRMINEWMP